MHLATQAFTRGTQVTNGQGRTSPASAQLMPPKITFPAGGHSEVQKRIGDFAQFYLDLTELLIVANFTSGQEFTCRPTTGVKGTAYTKGLRVKSAKTERYAVELSANYGSNDSCILCILSCPTEQRNAEAFHARLKTAEEQIRNETPEVTAARRALYAKRLAMFSKFAEATAPKGSTVLFVPPTPAPAAVAVAPEAPASDTPAPAPTKPSSIRLLDDEDALELFRLSLETKASPDGYINRSDVLKIIQDDVVDSPQASGGVLRGLLTAKHLVEEPPNGQRLRFEGRWLTEWMRKAPQGPIEVVSVQALLELDQLTDEAAGLRDRRPQVAASVSKGRTEVSELQTKLDAAKTQLASAEAELAQIDQRLSDPRLVDADEKLAVLQRLLSKKRG